MLDRDYSQITFSRSSRCCCVLRRLCGVGEDSMSACDNLDLAHLKIPPNSLEAEQSVLGGLMIANDYWDGIAELICEKDFFRPEHQIIFRCMSKLVEAGQPIDIVTLGNSMGAEDELERVGGFAYIAEIARNTPAAANVRAYATAVKNRARARTLITIGQNIADLGYDESQPIGDREELAQSALMQLGDNDGEDVVSTNQALKEVIEDIDRLFESGGGLTGVSTGFKDIDARTNGLQSSDFILIAGRPSMGKTALAMNIVEHVAFDLRKAVLVFSMEMPRGDLFKRMIASIGKIPFDHVRTGKLVDSEWPKLSAAVSKMKDSLLTVDDRPALTLAQIRSRARKLHKKNPLSLIVIDYLQLCASKARNDDNREQEISSISRGLKALAKELNCPLIAIAQLNRSCESRQNKRPINSDLRDSGQIEQDADLICMMYRDEYYNENTPDKGVAEAIWRKFRNGQIGTDYLASNLHQSRFDDLAFESRPKETNVTPIRKRGFEYE